LAVQTIDNMNFGKYDIIASMYKLLANPVRLRILGLLGNQSMGFSELMHALAVNPKVLSTNLSRLIEFRLVTKSYPHRVYVLTPQGRRILREQIEGVYDYLWVKPFREE